MLNLSDLKTPGNILFLQKKTILEILEKELADSQFSRLVRAVQRTAYFCSEIVWGKSS